MPDYTQQSSPMRFKGEALGDDDLLITRLAGTEALSELYAFELELLAPVDRPVDFAAVLGKGAVVALDVPGGEPRFFHGMVSRFAQGPRDERFLTYRATLVPRVWLLTKRVRSRIFQNLTVPQILARVFDGFKVTDEIQAETPGDGGSPLAFYPRDYCVQYRESDFAFAARLMEEEGIYHYFRQTAGGDEMVLSNTPQKHDPVPDPAVVIYDEVAGGVRDEGRVTGWEKVQEVRSGKVTLWDHHFELPDDRLVADQKIQASVPVGQVKHTLNLPVAEQLEVYDYPGGYAGRFDGITPTGQPQPAELDKLFQDNRRTARVRIQEEASGAISVEGTGTARQFTAGHRFTLERHFDADGDYVLTRVSHEAGFESGGYETADGGTGFAYTNEFAAVPLELPFRPPRVTPKPAVKGTQTATVVGPPGDEIFTDKYGRVKVQFHWDREGGFNAESSCWIRVATIWAGQGWGVIHIPRIGQEVVVDFLEGDPDQPIVIGSVYNADQVPPGNLPKEGMVSGLQSRSTPKGGPSNFNGMRANDTKSKEALDVQAEYDMSTLVKHDDTQKVLNDRKIDVLGKHTETITKDTSVTVLTGNFTHDVQTGTAFVHVKGAVTENFDTTQATTVAGDITVTSNKGKITVQEMSGEMYLYASGQIGAKADKNVLVIAAEEIKLITGKSSLHMTSDGKITMTGENVKVVGNVDASFGTGNQNLATDTSKTSVLGAEILSKANGNHTIFGAMVKIN